MRDPPVCPALHDPKLRNLCSGDRFGRERNIGAGLDMLAKQGTKIHSVKLIATENDVMVVRSFEEVTHVLPHGVGRPLIPLGAFRRLLRGEDVDEAARKIIELVARLDMAMERQAVELSQNVNRSEARNLDNY